MLMEDIQYDLYRITGKIDGWTFIKTLFSNRAFRRLYYYRKYRQNGRVGKKVISILSHMLFTKMSIELPWSIELGKGVLLLHPYSITFNSLTGLYPMRPSSCLFTVSLRYFSISISSMILSNVNTGSVMSRQSSKKTGNLPCFGLNFILV